ncbi:MAG: hypothetical protein H0X34_09675 [Chthoniobacterales bacterium]|nr:hypothetical protein [Chthoniobacterales bacterium]
MITDNTLPSGIHDLLRLGGEMAEGLRLHGPWLKMTQTPEAGFQTMLERLRRAEIIYGEARAAKADAGKESTAADKVLTDWLVRTRAFLTAVFGNRWSESWLQLGVTSRRTAIPKRMEPRISLARGMAHYLGKNPQYEYPVAHITEKDGEAIRQRMVKAQRELRAAKADCIVKKRARDGAERALRRKMRQVVVILGVSIRPEDRRWLDFGLHRPLRSLGTRRLIVSEEAGPSVSTPLVLPHEAPEAAADALAA